MITRVSHATKLACHQLTLSLAAFTLTSAGTNPPAFVYAIFFIYFIAFNVFALNMYLQCEKIGPWRNYLYGKRMHIILSLTAKTILAWLVFIGVFAPF